MKRFNDFIKRFAKNKLALIGIVVLAVIILAAIFAPILTKYDYYSQNLSESFLKPSKAHLMGTDKFGRDISHEFCMAQEFPLKSDLFPWQ